MSTKVGTDGGAAPHESEGDAAPAEDIGTEQRIFDAALHVFSLKGMDGARMQEIADHAGINRALLHYYFRTKAQLYEAVFAHGFGQFISGLTPSLKSGRAFEETLRTFVHGYMDYIRSHQAMARLMLNECLSGGEVLTSHFKRAMERPGEFPGLVFEERLREAMAAGEIREVDPEHTLLTVVSACLFPFVALPTVRIFHPEVEGDFDAFVEERKRHVVDLLRNALRPEGAPE